MTLLRINLKKEKRKFKKAVAIRTAVSPDLIWNPWSLEALLVSFERHVRRVGRGPGENRSVAEPTAPTFGGEIQGPNTHYDVDNVGALFEVKGLSGYERTINIGGEGNSLVTDFTSQICLVVGELREFKKVLDILDRVTARAVLTEGFSIQRFNDFFEELVPKLETGVEIARGTVIHAVDQFERITRFMIRAKAELEISKKKIGSVIFDYEGKTLLLEQASSELQLQLLRDVGVPPEEIARKFFLIIGQKITHPWLTNYGRFREAWENLAQAADVLTAATDGLLVVHEEYGWFLIPLSEVNTRLTFDSITRRSLRFRLNALPPKPVKNVQKTILRCISAVVEC